MKRIISLLLAVTMVAMFCVSFAEESESGNNKYLSEMKLMSLYYKLKPDDMTVDYIMRTYLDLMLYMNTNAMEYFNVGYYMTRDKDETAVDYVRKYEISVTNIVQVATDGYLDWLNGKMTDKEFLEILMMLVDGITESSK